MEIKFELNNDLYNTNINFLKNFFKINNEDELINILSKFAMTSFYEYIDMISKKGIPSRVSDVKEQRLFFLIKYFYLDQIPDEVEISKIFKINLNQSYSLLKNTLAKYRNELERALKNKIINILNHIEYENATQIYKATIFSKSIVDEINNIISNERHGLETIKKDKNSASKYIIPDDTFNFLNQRFLHQE